MAAFPSGTKTFFNQSSAPTGWTKDTTNNDYTLRVVAGIPSTTLNGTLDFSAAMVDTVWDATATFARLNISSDAADLPAHTHAYSTSYGTSWLAYNFQNYPGGAVYPFFTGPMTTVNSGTGGTGATHTHDITSIDTNFVGSGSAKLSVKYLDFILATKN